MGNNTDKPVQNCEITEQDLAILQLKTQRDKFKQVIKRKEECLEKDQELVRQLLKDGNKEKALLLLKENKCQENIIDQTLKQLSQLENKVQDLELGEIQKLVQDLELTEMQKIIVDGATKDSRHFSAFAGLAAFIAIIGFLLYK